MTQPAAKKLQSKTNPAAKRDGYHLKNGGQFVILQKQ